LVGAEPTGRHGDELRFRGKGSLAVVVRGPKRGQWFDYEADEGGDALGLVAHLHRCRIREARLWALDWLGIVPGIGRTLALAKPLPPFRSPRAAEPASTHARRLAAERLWTEAVEAAGTPVVRYLASRGLHLPTDAPIRFHPACPRTGEDGFERLPAMVALMTDPASGKPCGVHRSFLAADGSGKAEGKAKMMLGGAGVVRLVPDAEVGTSLGLAEGIETSLAVMQGFGWRPVWAAASAGGIARFPVLPGIEALTIFADADDGGAGMRAAEACGERWSAMARLVTLYEAPAGMDFDDAARGGAA
jgi:hypothetical protein